MLCVIYKNKKSNHGKPLEQCLPGLLQALSLLLTSICSAPERLKLAPKSPAGGLLGGLVIPTPTPTWGQSGPPGTILLLPGPAGKQWEAGGGGTGGRVRVLSA